MLYFLIICSTLDLFLSAILKGWNKSIGFSNAELYAKSLKKILKQIKYLEARLAVNREFFLIISKGKVFRADRKKIFMPLFTSEPVSSNIALFR